MTGAVYRWMVEWWRMYIGTTEEAEHDRAHDPTIGKTYALLLKQAARLWMTPEDVLECILANDLALLIDAVEQDTLSLDEPAATDEALAAVRRLSTLFADVSTPEA
jgi:hypothetical protein